MTIEPPGEPPQRFEVRVSGDSHMAWIRTRLAAERTMLAYLRTSVSLIGFGFAIVQFLHNVRGIPGAADPRFPNAPVYLGLALIFCGIVAAIIAMIEFRYLVRYLWSGGFAALAGVTPEGRKTPVYAIGAILILIGLFAFFSVLIRLA
jgi:putative membrane protein